MVTGTQPTSVSVITHQMPFDDSIVRMAQHSFSLITADNLVTSPTDSIVKNSS